MIKRTKKGFTLIELLVVIAIIGILASVVLASLNSARAKSRDARRVADLKQVQLALELYADSHSQAYPATADISGQLTGAACAGSAKCIPQYPVPPTGAGQGAYGYAATKSDGTACTTGANDCAKYHLGAVLEEGTNQALTSDADVILGFDGTSADCSSTAGTPQGQASPTEKCYDVSN